MGLQEVRQSIIEVEANIGCSNPTSAHDHAACVRMAAARVDRIGSYAIAATETTALASAHARSLVAVARLRADLAEMELRSPSGNYTGLNMFGQMLDSLEAFVRHHQLVASMPVEEVVSDRDS